MENNEKDLLHSAMNDVVGKKELKDIITDAPDWAKFVLITNYAHVEEHEHEGEVHESHDVPCTNVSFYGTDDDGALGMVYKAKVILSSE